MNEFDVKKSIIFINKTKFYKEGGSKMYEDLFNEFEAIDKKYVEKNSNDIKKLELERMLDVEINADVIRSDAEKSLEGYQEDNISKIEDKYLSGVEKADNKELTKILSAESKKESVSDKLDLNKKVAENRLFARGLGRSSIIINNAKAFDDSKLKEYARINENLSSELNLIEREREILLEQKNSALKSFDIAYAIKLADKIESLNKELTKKQAEVDKYNASISKQESDYEAKQQKEVEEHNKTLSQIIDKNGIFAINVIKQKDKYEKALEYFNGKSAEEALLELTNNSAYKEQLGDRYDLLMKKMWERI